MILLKGKQINKQTSASCSRTSIRGRDNKYYKIWLIVWFREESIAMPIITVDITKTVSDLQAEKILNPLHIQVTLYQPSSYYMYKMLILY